MADGRWQDGDGRMAEAEGGGRTERWRLRSPGSVFPARVPCRCWLCLEGSQDGMKPERAAGFCAKANAAVLRAALLCCDARDGRSGKVLVTFDFGPSSLGNLELAMDVGAGRGGAVRDGRRWKTCHRPSPMLRQVGARSVGVS